MSHHLRKAVRAQSLAAKGRWETQHWAGTDLEFLSNRSSSRAQGTTLGTVFPAVSLMPSTVLGIKKVLPNHKQLTECTGFGGLRGEAELCALSNVL